MALHTELPIHRTGVRLLSLAVKVQEQMPRSVKRILGDKVTQHCVDMLDLMALANASQHEARAEYIQELLKRQRAVTVLLDDLDQHVKHKVRAPHYVRYVDDFILLHDSPQWLNQARASVEGKLAGLRLALNPRKTILQPVERGIDFVGHLIKPWRRITRPRTLHVALGRLHEMPAEDLHQSANSYFGLLRQASHSHHDRTRVANVLRDRGHVVAGDITKVFRRPAA